MVPRENKNNAYAKFGGTKSIMVFSEMAYRKLASIECFVCSSYVCNALGWYVKVIIRFRVQFGINLHE